MEAIANVVMNRLGHEGFPSTICEIVKQGQEHARLPILLVVQRTSGHGAG